MVGTTLLLIRPLQMVIVPTSADKFLKWSSHFCCNISPRFCSLHLSSYLGKLLSIYSVELEIPIYFYQNSVYRYVHRCFISAVVAHILKVWYTNREADFLFVCAISTLPIVQMFVAYTSVSDSYSLLQLVRDGVVIVISHQRQQLCYGLARKDIWRFYTQDLWRAIPWGV